MNLKQLLLQTTLIVDNEYLDAYCALIAQNIKTDKQKFYTQGHHVLPCALYKSRNLADKDINNYIVNLLFKDHILAHYYLCLCAADSNFRYRMIAAIEFIFGKSKNNSNETIKESMKDFLLTSDKYQIAYQEYAKKRYLRLHSPVAREKARKKILGHRTTTETRYKISAANKGQLRTEETKKKLSISHKGRSTWNKGLESTIRGKIAVYNKQNLQVLYILPDELSLYLQTGLWLRGNIRAGRKTGKGTRDRKVVCLELNIIFNSIKEAAKFAHTVPSNIHQVLAGKAKTAGKYHWEYVR